MNPMIDVYILFAAYFMGCIALGVSLYALYRINELIDHYTKRPKQKSPTVYVKPNVPQKPKGFWDN